MGIKRKISESRLKNCIHHPRNPTWIYRNNFPDIRGFLWIILSFILFLVIGKTKHFLKFVLWFIIVDVYKKDLFKICFSD